MHIDEHFYRGVELELLYSNRELETARLRLVRSTADSVRHDGRKQRPRQRHRRLSMTEVAELIKEYEQGALVKELAQRFGVHRVTVTALLQRHGVELRRSGLVPEVIPVVARMYSQGWSCARLGELFGADASTVWRALHAAGVKMRPSNGRGSS
jgi:hypothetical protein